MVTTKIKNENLQTLKISEAELSERIAILKRFKKLLKEQRDKFQEYLNALENQHGKIEDENEDSILAHAELEQQIVKNIGSLKRVIDPMRSLYESKGIALRGTNDAKDIETLQIELSDLQDRVLRQNEKNRALLKSRLAKVRSQLAALTAANPFRGRKSIFAEHPISQSGTLIQIEA